MLPCLGSYAYDRCRLTEWVLGVIYFVFWMVMMKCHLYLVRRRREEGWLDLNLPRVPRISRANLRVSRYSELWASTDLMLLGVKRSLQPYWIWDRRAHQWFELRDWGDENTGFLENDWIIPRLHASPCQVAPLINWRPLFKFWVLHQSYPLVFSVLHSIWRRT